MVNKCPLLLPCLIIIVYFFNGGESIAVTVQKQLPAKLGETLIIPCKTDADLQSLTVQWYIVENGKRNRVYYKKQTVVYAQNSQYSTRVSIVDDLSLQVKNVSVIDDREFICSITSSSSTEENSTFVNVSATPHLTSSPSLTPLLVNNISQTVAVCVAEGGYPEPKIIWVKNRDNIIEDAEITPEVTKNQGLFRVSSVLSIRPQKSDKDSMIHCSVTTFDGATVIEDSPAMTVTVHYPPEGASLKVDPSDSIKEGDTVTLTCVTDANPPPIYTFFKDSRLLGNAGVENVWKMSKMYRRNSGVYKCEARYTTSPWETTAKAEHQITVHYMNKLEILGVPNEDLDTGGNFTMTCKTTGSGNIIYYWKKDGKRIQDGPILSRLQVSANDSGSYTCVAELFEVLSVHEMVNITVKGSLSLVQIICIAVAAAAGIILFIAGVVCWICYKRGVCQKKSSEENGTPAEAHPLHTLEQNGSATDT